MIRLRKLVVFAVDELTLSLDLAVADRFVRAVEVSPLPGAPDVVRGVVDIYGEVVPLFDVRQRLNRPARIIGIDDLFLVARTSRRRVALLVDAARGVIEVSEARIVAAQTIIPGLDQVQGVVQLEDGLVLIHDLDRFLTAAESNALDAAISNRG